MEFLQLLAMDNKRDRIMKNELGWNNERLGEEVAKFCYAPHDSEKDCALVWVIEALVLPKNTPNGYTEKGMAHLIKVRLNEASEHQEEE
jgi:hypothetical protein